MGTILFEIMFTDIDLDNFTRIHLPTLLKEDCLYGKIGHRVSWQWEICSTLLDRVGGGCPIRMTLLDN